MSISDGSFEILFQHESPTFHFHDLRRIAGIVSAEHRMSICYFKPSFKMMERPGLDDSSGTRMRTTMTTTTRLCRSIQTAHIARPTSSKAP